MSQASQRVRGTVHTVKNSHSRRDGPSYHFNGIRWLCFTFTTAFETPQDPLCCSITFLLAYQFVTILEVLMIKVKNHIKENGRM